MNKKSFRGILLALWIASALMLNTGCSIRGLIVKETEPLIEGVKDGFLMEADVELARAAFPMTIKLAEGFYRYYPQSPYYSGQLCFLNAAYAFAFLDNTPYNDLELSPEQIEASVNKLLATYHKAKNFGEISLSVQIKDFSTHIYDLKRYPEVLAKVRKKHVETLYWFNFAWAMIIFNDLSNSKTLVHLEIVKAIAERIEEVHANYLGGINYAVLIAFYGGRSEILGGDFKKCQAYYKQAHKIGGKLSIVHEYVFMRYTTKFHPSGIKQFETTYRRIQAFDYSRQNDFIFLNAMLKQKAELLYSKKDWWF